MSDDSFIREVEEELRSDQMRSLWDRFGRYIIGAAVLIVVATAGYRGWLFYAEGQAANSGDAFIEAVELSNEGKHQEAIAALGNLVDNGSGQYPALATIRLAAEHAKSGNPEKAIEAFDAIANDTSFDETLRNVARLRAGLLLVDHGTYDQVADRLEQLSATGQAFRHSAREGLGLSAWKEKKYKRAYSLFEQIANDQASPQGIRNRAGIMLELLAGEGITSGE